LFEPGAIRILGWQFAETAGAQKRLTAGADPAMHSAAFAVK